MYAGMIGKDTLIRMKMNSKPEAMLVLNNVPLKVGGIIFPELDQADFTGPFEVLSRIPNSTFHILGKSKEPVRDAKGLILVPEITLADSPQLDVLLVPGGAGVNALMEDLTVLNFVREQAAGARLVFSVCTGALVLGATGMLGGRRATTHWASHHLLKYFGAIPINERVVIDGKIVTAAGVTAGIDGALQIVSLLRGERAAQDIQLYIQYAPEPPFNSGNPESAPAEIVQARRDALKGLLEERLRIIERVTGKEGRNPKTEGRKKKVSGVEARGMLF
jgi:cyclohexyl-isocyanide hydratase